MRELNRDSFPIKNYELTPEGYLKTWVVIGVADKKMEYQRDGKKIIESIQADKLFDESSVNTAIGKPIVLNHAPKAVTASNHKEYAKGTLLQQFERDGNDLVLASIIHDADAVKGVMSGKYKYTSSTYWADKSLNKDGVYDQSNRLYTDVALLTEEYKPRAGNTSGVKISGLDVTSDASSSVSNPEESKKKKTEDNKETEDMTYEIIQKYKSQLDSLQRDRAEVVELLSNWKKVLQDKNKSINYDATAHDIKRSVLSCYYPEKTINSLSNDLVLDGFWINFVSNSDALINNKANNDSSQKFELPDNSYQFSFVTPNQDTSQVNYDAEMEKEREELIKIREGRK